jgi:DNA polymerase-3 subunit epsilon
MPPLLPGVNISMTAFDTADLEILATELTASGQYRLLRRLEPRTEPIHPCAEHERVAIFLDVETTGLDPVKEVVIELAMVPFVYSEDGAIVRVGEAFQSYRDPGIPIPAEVTALTGITDDMVRAQVLDLKAVDAFASDASLIIAHNANFDRKFAERISAVFEQKPWACTMSQIPWAQEGIRGCKLDYLAMANGFFFAEHRAAMDCFAGVEILKSTLPNSGRTALSALIEEAEKVTTRIWAEKAPFSKKDVLKARDYRWSNGEHGGRRAWYVDVPKEKAAAENAFLCKEVFGREVQLPEVALDASCRFSTRLLGAH